MKEFFDPIPVPVAILMLLLGVGIVLLMSVPNAWVFPFLKLFGVRFQDRKAKDAKRESPRPPSASG